MGFILLMTLLSTGLTMAAFDMFGSDNDTADGEQPHDDEEQPHEGDGADDMLSDEIDDVITDDAVEGGDVDSVETHVEGNHVRFEDERIDDMPAVEVDDYTSIGTETDDTITGSGVDTIFGRGGDDVLADGAGSHIHGGDGNDAINYDMTRIHDATGLADGGAGDDTISVSAHTRIAHSDYSSTHVTGGEGNDSFKLDMELADYFREANGEPGDVERAHIGSHFMDFTPGEDTLTVEIERDTGHEDREMLSADLKHHPFTLGDGTKSEPTTLQMRFSGTETEPELITSVSLGMATGITMDDIVIIDEAAPAQD